jgi:hypothetical protein
LPLKSDIVGLSMANIEKLRRFLIEGPLQLQSSS